MFFIIIQVPIQSFTSFYILFYTQWLRAQVAFSPNTCFYSYKNQIILFTWLNISTTLQEITWSAMLVFDTKH